MFEAVKGLSCEYDVDYSKKGYVRYASRCYPSVWTTGSPGCVCDRCGLPILWENWFTKRPKPEGK